MADNQVTELNFNGETYLISDLTPRAVEGFNTLIKAQQKLNDLAIEVKIVQGGQTQINAELQQIIEEGLIAHNLGNQREREAMVIDILEKVGLEPNSRNRYPHEFSGGQRQRIGIARAFYKRAQVLVFDEATSALDIATEDAVMHGIDTLEQDFTILIIAHRLSTIEKADIILVLSNLLILILIFQVLLMQKCLALMNY